MATIRAEIINNSKTIRVTDLTDYTANPNSRGVLVIRDPNGNYIVNNGDFDNPDITVGAPTSAEFSLNLVDGAIASGTYIIDYDVDYDLDDVSDDTTQLTFAYSVFDLVTASVEVTSSLADATIQSTDITSYDSRVTLNSRTHTLKYPDTRGSSSSSDKSTNTTIALIELFTGEYNTNSVSITSGILIEVSTTYWIYDVITASKTHTVWGSDGISDLESSIAELYARYIASLGTDNGSATAALETTVTRVNASWSLYKINRDDGDRDGAATYLNEIAEILSAEDITILEPDDESVPVAREYPGYATAWVYGSGVPADTLARNGDFYFRTDTNGVYNKASGTWTLIGTLGANTIIQFSADGSTGWTTTYANGLNYIRFSGDGGVSWTVVSKFIDGYVYYAYASDGSGTDFIATDNPVFTFNPVLEYIALKKFPASHNGDLVAGDFTGLFAKYRDAGIISYCSNPSVSIPTDSDGNNPTFPATNPQVYVYDGDTDVTTSWTITINTNTDVTATIVNDDEINITAIAADTGSILIDCDRSGYDTLQVLVLVSKIKAGQAIVDGTSVDDLTIEINISSKLALKDGGITGDKLNAGIVDDVTIEIDTNTLQVKDGGISIEKLDIRDMNRSFIKLGDSTGIASSDGTGKPVITWMDSNRMAYVYATSNIHYLSCLNYNQTTDTWSVIGTPLAAIAGGWQVYDIVNLGKNRVCVLLSPISGTTKAVVYTFNGSIWTNNGEISFDNSTTDKPVALGITSFSNTDIGLLMKYQYGGVGDEKFELYRYAWGGASFSQVGNKKEIISSTSLGITTLRCSISAINENNLYAYYFDVTSSSTYRLNNMSFDGTDFTIEDTSAFNFDEKAVIQAISENEFIFYRDDTSILYNYKYVDGEPYLLPETYSITSDVFNMAKTLDNNIAFCPHVNSTVNYAEMLFRLKINE